MTDTEQLDRLEMDFALLKAHWFAMGTAIHQRDWNEVQDVFRRMGAKLGESAEAIDWSFQVGSEG